MIRFLLAVFALAIFSSYSHAQCANGVCRLSGRPTPAAVIGRPVQAVIAAKPVRSVLVATRTAVSSVCKCVRCNCAYRKQARYSFRGSCR